MFSYGFAIVWDKANGADYLSREDLSSPPSLIITATIHVSGDQPTIQSAINAETVSFRRDSKIVLALQPEYYSGEAQDLGICEP